MFKKRLVFITGFFSLLFYLFVLLHVSPPIHAQYAQNKCNPVVITNPSPLRSTTRGATFTVDVGTTKEPGITGWRMEFQCGGRFGVGPINTPNIRMRKLDATPLGDNKSIQVDLQSITGSTGHPCEFDPANNPIQIKVFSVISGAEQHYCTVNYQVQNQDAQCQLELRDRDRPPAANALNPQMKTITIDSQLSVAGSNLGQGERYIPFLDGRPLGGFLNTPGFETPIPANMMTVGIHEFNVRKFEPARGIDIVHLLGPSLILNPQDIYKINQAVGPPLCQLRYTVGTQDNPGSLIGASSGIIKTPVCNDPKTCTVAGGEACDPATGKPASDGKGLMTAIGCVPTEPQAFVSGIFKFVAGFAGAATLLLMFFGILQMITAAGNPEQVKRGMDQFTASIWGLVFLLIAVLLLKFIGVDILNIPGFK